MTQRELFLLSLVVVAGLGYAALKITEKPSSLSASFDLTTGRSTLEDTPQIKVAQSEADRLLLQLDLSEYKRAQFVIQFQDKPLEGACLNIGDSAGNDGWGGDNGQSSHNAELQIIGPSGGFLLYGSDDMLKAHEESETTEKKSQLLKGEPALVAAKDLLTLEITDGSVAWSKPKGKADKLQSPHLFALNGQPDAKTGKAGDATIFAAFNRSIADPQATGKCVKTLNVTLTR